MSISDEVLASNANVAWLVEPGLAHDSATEVDMPNGLTAKAHCFIGLTFTASGSTVTPTAGTVTIKVETWNNPGVWQEITDGTSIDATAPLDTLSVAANVTKIQITPTTVSGNSVDGITLRVTAMAG